MHNGIYQGAIQNMMDKDDDKLKQGIWNQLSLFVQCQPRASHHLFLLNYLRKFNMVAPQMRKCIDLQKKAFLNFRNNMRFIEFGGS